jgi:magnesium chelatase family protein
MERCTYFGEKFFFNSRIPIDLLIPFMQMNDSCLKFISELAEEMRFSFRAFHSLLRVARTIADLRTAEAVEEVDLALALEYRLALPSIFSERSNIG